MQKVTFNCLDYNEFNTLVRDNTSLENYCFVAENESSNMVSHTYGDIKRDPYATDIEDTNFEDVGVHELLEYFVELEILPEGNYLIEVYW